MGNQTIKEHGEDKITDGAPGANGGKGVAKRSEKN